jgi:hypothetical protein
MFRQLGKNKATDHCETVEYKREIAICHPLETAKQLSCYLKNLFPLGGEW